jgi:hypothetical protein
MVRFLTQNPDLGKFWRALERRSFVHSLAILNLLLPFGTVFGHLVIYTVAKLYFSPVLGYCVKKNLATLALSVLF